MSQLRFQAEKDLIFEVPTKQDEIKDELLDDLLETVDDSSKKTD